MEEGKLRISLRIEDTSKDTVQIVLERTKNLSASEAQKETIKKLLDELITRLEEFK